MYTVVQVIEGIKDFIEEEVIMKVSGLSKWFVGAGMSLAMENAVETYNKLKGNELIMSLGVIHDDDTIDVDKIFMKLKEQAEQHGAVTLNVPMIGAMTFRAEDLDHLYMDIKKH